jgi:hypothetical protein
MLQATEQFKMRIRPDVNQMLETLANREGRSKANMVTMLILEKGQALQVTKKNSRIATQGAADRRLNGDSACCCRRSHLAVASYKESRKCLPTRIIRHS